MDEGNAPLTPVAPVIVKSGNPFIIPGAILIGFAMIAAAIYFSNVGKTTTPTALGVPNTEETPKDAIRPVDERDHIRGNPNAPIVLVEYSDFDCPFCKRFHEDTMAKLMNEFGSDGKVAWVYRHFPIEQLHPNAPKLALASECVAELAGNDGFWKFADLVFGEREVNAQTDVTKLTDYAVKAGAKATDFNTCMTEERHKDRVAEDFADGAGAGIQGTPHTFVIAGGQQGVISGAQPYDVVKKIVESLLTQMESGTQG